MKTRKKRFFSVLLALCLILSLMPAPVALAASPNTSNLSNSYKSGPYYQNLMKVQLTGNQITDLIAVAASQLGYHESNSTNDLSGTGTGTGNCTEYGRFNGSNGYAWCASFVSWCFRKANIPTSIMPTSSGVGKLRLSVYNNGATWHSVNSGYYPKTGDLVLYESMGGGYSYYQYAKRDANGVPSSSSHVGIVVSDFNPSTQTYCVIDGNGTEGSVKYLTNQKLYMGGYTKDGSTINRIQGFVTPAYTTGSGASYNGSTVDTSLTVTLTVPTDPTYLAKQSVSNTNATVVCRVSKPVGSSITTSGLILSAADGTVIKDYSEKVTNVGASTTVFHSWYDINKELGVTLSPGTTYRYRFYAVVNGKTFYGNTYSFQTTGSAPTYTLNFDPAGGTVSPTSKNVVGNATAGDLPIPTRSGYEFLGWYTSNGSIYSANTIVTGNLSLTARWSQEEDLEEDTPPEELIRLIYTDPLNSRDQVELTKNEPKLHIKIEKPAGAVVSYFQVAYFDANGTLLGNTRHDFSSDAVLAAKSETTFTVDVSQTFPDFSSLKVGDVRNYECEALVGDLIYILPVQEFVIVNGTAPESEYTVSFYDLDNMMNYGEITQTNGQKFILPPEPSKTGYQFSGWKLNGSIITSSTIVNLSKNALAQAVWTKVESQPAPSNAFVDVQKGIWYEAAVTWAVDQGITTGTSTTTFSPEESCTRAQAVTFLWRAAGSPDVGSSNPFSDVSRSDYYYKAVLWAVQKGITSGTSATTFGPDENCQRSQIVTFLYRYAGEPSVSGSNSFVDVDSSAYYINAVRWAVANGVTNGTSATTFGPEENCTRAQIMTLLYRHLAD